jgi:hypothetical protein
MIGSIGKGRRSSAQGAINSGIGGKPSSSEFSIISLEILVCLAYKKEIKYRTVR